MSLGPLGRAGLGVLAALCASSAHATIPSGGNELRVGPLETYLTVMDAYAAAVSGDEIVVMPGVYEESFVFDLAKEVVI